VKQKEKWILGEQAASLMLNHGIPVLIVSKRLGHSKPSITIDVYGHLIPSKQEEAAQLNSSFRFVKSDWVEDEVRVARKLEKELIAKQRD